MRISDWSSDVCSSDLIATATSLSALHQHTRLARSLQLGKLTITLGGLSLLTLLIGRIDRHHGRLLMLEDRLAEIAGQRGAELGDIAIAGWHAVEHVARRSRIGLRQLLLRGHPVEQEIGRASCRERVCQDV